MEGAWAREDQDGSETGTPSDHFSLNHSYSMVSGSSNLDFDEVLLIATAFVYSISVEKIQQALKQAKTSCMDLGYYSMFLYLEVFEILDIRTSLLVECWVIMPLLFVVNTFFVLVKYTFLVC